MRLIALSALGGLVWIGLRGEADLLTFLVGALITAALALPSGLPVRGKLAPARFARGVVIVARLLARFLIAAVVANLEQLRLVLSPTLRIRPRWVRFHTRLKQPASRTALGVLISMTPGTVTADLEGDQLLIHILDDRPREDAVAEIRERFESLLLELEAL
jgi:multisubunit Na+/H+ antiporter MnhE subunit